MNRERRQFFEMVLAAVCPPLLTIATASLTFWLDDLTGEMGRRDHSQVLMPLMITGAVVLAAAILLDLLAIERLPASTAADVRGVLSTSSIGSLAFLAVWVTAAARQQDYAGEMVMFLCLPTLTICGVLLWFTARAVKRVSLRALLLALFVLATVWVEGQCQTATRGEAEDRIFMFNSLLVAFAVALRLGVWGATEFSEVPKGSSA